MLRSLNVKKRQEEKFFDKESAVNVSKGNGADRGRLVIKLSSKRLTEEQQAVLERGLKFAPTPRHVPIARMIYR